MVSQNKCFADDGRVAWISGDDTSTISVVNPKGKYNVDTKFEGSYSMQTDAQLKIAVCDDEPTDLKEIVELTGQILRDASIDYQISEYDSGNALLEDIQNGVQYQLLLLDVLLEDLDGIALAAKLRQQENHAPIIFISVNRELALRGYEVAAARYLAKPLDFEKLKEALLFCCENLQKNKEILLPIDQEQCRIPLSSILYVEAFERGSRFVLENEMLDTRLKFNEVDAMLPKASFVMCHRAYIVNLAHTKRLRPREFELKTGATIPVSKYRYQEVRKKFFQYVTD